MNADTIGNSITNSEWGDTLNGSDEIIGLLFIGIPAMLLALAGFSMVTKGFIKVFKYEKTESNSTGETEGEIEEEKNKKDTKQKNKKKNSKKNNKIPDNEPSKNKTEENNDGYFNKDEELEITDIDDELESTRQQVLDSNFKIGFDTQETEYSTIEIKKEKSKKKKRKVEITQEKKQKKEATQTLPKLNETKINNLDLQKEEELLSTIEQHLNKLFNNEVDDDEIDEIY